MRITFFSVFQQRALQTARRGRLALTSLDSKRSRPQNLTRSAGREADIIMEAITRALYFVERPGGATSSFHELTGFTGNPRADNPNKLSLVSWTILKFCEQRSGVSGLRLLKSRS